MDAPKNVICLMSAGHGDKVVVEYDESTGIEEARAAFDDYVNRHHMAFAIHDGGRSEAMTTFRVVPRILIVPPIMGG